MPNLNQAASMPIAGGDQACWNYGGTDIPANSAVLVDLVNTQGVNALPGVVLATAAGVVIPAAGITVDIIKAGKSGRVRFIGYAVCQVEGSLNAGDFVQVGNTTAKLGRVKKCAQGASIGMALCPAVDGDTIAILMGLNGANQSQAGSAVLVAGTVTVATGLTVSATSFVRYGRSLTGGTVGHLSYVLTPGAPGVGSVAFTSSSGTDTSTIAYEIVG